MDKAKPRNLHLLVAVILFVVLRVIFGLGACSDMGLTAAGASTLALFIVTIYLWITYGTGWISLMSIGLLGFTGICSASTVLANSFGNSTTVVVIGTLLLSVALDETGVTKLIANWFISRKLVDKRPYAFFTMFLLATLIVTCFMEATASAIIFVTLGRGILENLGYKQGDKFSKALFLGILWVVCLGMAATPICHPITLLMLGTLEKLVGTSISWLSFMMIGIPFAIIGFICVQLIIRFIFHPDCEKYNAYDVNERQKELQPLDKRGKVTSIVYIILIVMWLFPDIFGSLLPEVSAVLKSMGVALPALIAVALLCAIPVDGKPVLDYKLALSKISWPLIFFIACIFVYASVFSLEAGGINVFLKALVSPLASSLSPFMLIAVFLLIVAILTNFASNAVTGVIGLTVCVPTLLAIPEAAAWSTAFGVLATVLCNFGISTPGGSGFVAIAEQGDYITSGDVFKYGMMYTFVVYLIVMLVFWPSASSIF